MQQNLLRSSLKQIKKNSTCLKTNLRFSMMNGGALGSCINHNINSSTVLARMFNMSRIGLRQHSDSTIDQDAAFSRVVEDKDLFSFMEECILIGKRGKSVFMSKDLIERVEKEANKGNARAIFILGECHATAVGVKVDYPKAFGYYLKSAECGYNKGAHMVGFCYKNGMGVTIDLKKAMEWFMKSANGGIPLSAYELACFYINGEVCEVSTSEAKKWALKAASNEEKDIPKAKEMVGRCYLVEENYTESFKWMKKASESGLPESNYWVGWSYLTGKGTTQDYTKAMEYLQKAQSPQSFFRIGSMYELGFGVSPDKKIAFEWYKKGADLGDAPSQYMVGIQYFEEELYTESYNYLLKSAGQGEGIAMLSLGRILINGYPGIQVNRSEGEKWIDMAAKLGYKIDETDV